MVMANRIAVAFFIGSSAMTDVASSNRPVNPQSVTGALSAGLQISLGSSFPKKSGPMTPMHRGH